MTTLDRLFRKQLVGRRMYDRAYLYTALVTSEQWANDVVKAVIEQLLAGPQASRNLVLTCVLRVLNQDPELLKSAEQLLRSSRQQLNRINEEGTELGWWPT
jgi:predicted transcriptional regulator